MRSTTEIHGVVSAIPGEPYLFLPRPGLGLRPPTASSFAGGAENTKAQDTDPLGRRESVAACRTAEPADVVPATTPVYTDVSRRWASGIDDMVIRKGAVPVVAPFPDISMHVVQTPRVRLLPSDRVQSGDS